MNQLKDELINMSFDSPSYQNLSHYKIINVLDGEIQYFRGYFNFKGER